MGTTSSQITQSQFLKAWRINDRMENFTLWQHKDNPSHKLEQYLVYWDDSAEAEELYQLRKNNPYLVNAYALRNDGASCGVDHQTKNIFLERVPFRLSNVRDIPYPDLLHLYDATINGFQQLSSIVGHFRIDQDQIGVNERGQVKVWLNTAFERSAFMPGQSCQEAVMLKDLLDILSTTTDSETYPPGVPTVYNYVMSPTPPLALFQLEDRFVSYLKQFCEGRVPTALSCVFEAGGTGRINNWCRNHDSYGFSGRYTRLPEKIYQSKLFNSNQPMQATEPPPNSPQYGIPKESIRHSMPQPNQQRPLNQAPVSKQEDPLLKLQPVPEIAPKLAPNNAVQPVLAISQPIPQQVSSQPQPVLHPASKPIPQPVLNPVSQPISQPVPVVRQVNQVPVIPRSAGIMGVPVRVATPKSSKTGSMPSIEQHPEEHATSHIHNNRRYKTQLYPSNLRQQPQRTLSIPLMVHGATSYNLLTSYPMPNQPRNVPPPKIQQVARSAVLSPPIRSNLEVKPQVPSTVAVAQIRSQQPVQFPPNFVSTALKIPQAAGVIPANQLASKPVNSVSQPSLQATNPLFAQPPVSQASQLPPQHVPIPSNKTNNIPQQTVARTPPIEVNRPQSVVRQPPALIVNQRTQSIPSRQPINANVVVQPNVVGQSTEPKMQQQRVISQKIQVKEDKRPSQTIINNTYQPITQTRTQDRQSSQINTQLSSLGRRVQQSFNINEQRFGAQDDGKSSPEFLALISQLKDSIGQGATGEVYSRVVDTPIQNMQNEFMQNGDRSEVVQVVSNYLVDYKANQDVTSTNYYSKYMTEVAGSSISGGEFGGMSLYDSHIDPELKADMQKYQ